MRLGSDWKVVAAVGGQTWLITERAILSEAGVVTPFVDQTAPPRP
jgi:hypothetical protein